MTRQTITVDIAPGKDPVKWLRLTQGDIGRPLGVYIKQNDVALDCTTYTAELYVLKPDGNYFSTLLRIDGVETNLIKWETAEQETPLAGECAAQIRIRKDTVNVGTAEFIEYVEESPNQIGIDSITEIDTIEKYCKRAEEAVSHYPRVNQAGYWTLWDESSEEWISTGVIAHGPQGETGPQGPTGPRGATGPQGPTGPGVPSGGSAGQFLVKVNGTDFNTQWSDAVGEVVVKDLVLIPSAAVQIPSVGESASYNMAGMTADHRLISWNFSSSEENYPPVNLSWATYEGYFTITNSGGTTSETIKPMFVHARAIAITEREGG